MSKRALYIADSLDNARGFQQVLAEQGVDVAAGSTMKLRRLMQPGDDRDLVIFEARGTACAFLEEVESLAEERRCALLLIVDEVSVRDLQLPTLIPCDFVMHGAGNAECSARIRRLLGDSGEHAEINVIKHDNMIINLDTYQVTVAGEPVDFTYLEYALLSFLVRHPKHTFSRDVLLQRVWGFDYYGGSRTVDVHVRRIRSKIGPELAQRLETVRGVGYLWNSD
ncbi:MAG: winged helix-turn-helix domain-containing protein [Eggerthellaceae bacterium]|nr:winged helix-turn-helix domain-containing protein [Eggerthellaceae bacterium]